MSTIHPIGTTGSSNKLITPLRQAFVTNPCDKRRFIPCQKLEELCDEQSVEKELAKAFPDNDASSIQRLTRWIYHGQAQDTSITSQPCRKIFAILVLLNKVGLIKSFLEHPLCDNDLPLSSTPEFTWLSSRRKEHRNHLYFPDEDDGYAIAENFIEKQWSVLVPTFNAPTSGRMRCNVYEFDEKTILPIERISKKKYPGGFGLVEKVKIHREHNGFVSFFFS